MLFEAPPPLPGVSLWVVVPSTLLVATFFVFLVGAALRTLAQRPYSGREGLLRMAGEALTSIDRKHGKVFVAGERWNARSEDPIPEGAEVEVLGIEGMTLLVKQKAR
jgi:membrane-bound serine protease (ClpP class)